MIDTQARNIINMQYGSDIGVFLVDGHRENDADRMFNLAKQTYKK